MEPATPSSVMGDSEASDRPGGTEKNAGTIEIRYEIRNAGMDTGCRPLDLSDVLLTSLYPMPAGYNPRPKNRHERRRNRALLRHWARVAIAEIVRSPV